MQIEIKSCKYKVHNGINSDTYNFATPCESMTHVHHSMKLKNNKVCSTQQKLLNANKDQSRLKSNHLKPN